MIYGRTVQLSPLVVLISVLVGAALAGILGALAAIPVAGSIQVIVRDAARGTGASGSRKRAGDPPLPLPEQAPVAQWKSVGLLSRWSEVRILPGALAARRCVASTGSGTVCSTS